MEGSNCIALGIDLVLFWTIAGRAKGKTTTSSERRRERRPPPGILRKNEPSTGRYWTAETKETAGREEAFEGRESTAKESTLQVCPALIPYLFVYLFLFSFSSPLLTSLLAFTTKLSCSGFDRLVLYLSIVLLSGLVLIVVFSVVLCDGTWCKGDKPIWSTYTALINNTTPSYSSTVFIWMVTH